MNTHSRRSVSSVVVMLALLMSLTGAVSAQSPVTLSPIEAQTALGTAFTYQGQLKNASGLVNGNCDFQFSLWDSLSNSTGQIGTTQNKPGISVSNGLFAVSLDFGNVFTGEARWLQIAVKCNGDSDFIQLTPRQMLTPTPYALYAPNSGSTAALQSRAVAVITPTLNQVLKWNGTSWMPANDETGSGSGSAWSLTGNASTNPLTSFVGTTDNVSLTLRVSNSVALRLLPNATSPNLIGGYVGNWITPTAEGATIAGGGLLGNSNSVTSKYGTVSGGSGNTAGNISTVGGGASNDASGFAATVSGGQNNAASINYATVGGGDANRASGIASTIGGGYGNTLSGPYATIGGGRSISVTGQYAVVSGGNNITVTGSYAGVGAGADNLASGNYAVVGGGNRNIASGIYAIIDGGFNNIASGGYATVGGGYHGVANGIGAFIGGGGYDGSNTLGNQAAGVASTIGGGLSNIITPTGSYAFVGGGGFNTASQNIATVSGGWHNTAGGAATVGGGWYNTANGNAATVAGGSVNVASGWYATVGGGAGNSANGITATVGGGEYNTVSGQAATTSGGYSNTVSGDFAVVAGGGGFMLDDYGSENLGNRATGKFATVSGGCANTAAGEGATVGGGGGYRNVGDTDLNYVPIGNDATGDYSTVSGGQWNHTSGERATVSGGYGNSASGVNSTVSGGYFNTASGANSTVPGGYDAAATLHGQMAYASGSFWGWGDAQASLYMMRRTTSSDGVWENLYLDGSSALLTLANDRAMTFDINIVGSSYDGEAAGYHCWGIVKNVGGTISLVGSNCGDEYENDTAWNVTLVAADPSDALLVQVMGNGEVIQWVAAIRTVETKWLK